MFYIRKSEQRGKANFGWLQSLHSFSFGRYYDASHMGISVLRVINDDFVAPAQGFDTHGHRDMEIISYVTSGALKHKDSRGNEHIVAHGEIQLMSAGSGIQHSEYNASHTEPVSFLQIWIKPNVLGQVPSYQQQQVIQKGALTLLVSPSGQDNSLMIKQDMTLSRLVLVDKEEIELNTANRLGYLHIISGSLNIDTNQFVAGDAIGFNPNQSINILSTGTLDALWFDLPLE